MEKTIAIPRFAATSSLIINLSYTHNFYFSLLLKLYHHLIARCPNSRQYMIQLQVNLHSRHSVGVKRLAITGRYCHMTNGAGADHRYRQIKVSCKRREKSSVETAS